MIRTCLLVLSSSLLIALISDIPAIAITYTVKASGGNFTTLQACSNAAIAGDTCEVYAGAYSGWTQTKSGSSGSPIIFNAHAGDSVVITGRATVTNTKFITINGFRFTGNTQAIFAADGSGITTSDIVFSNNIIIWTTQTDTSPSIYLYGDRNRIENNDASGSGSDFANVGGQNVVIRGNRYHDVTGASSGEHLDFVQVIGGGTTPTLRFSLIENNVAKNCMNDGGNCHFIIVRTGSGPVADTIIARFNYAQNLDGSGASWGGVGDNVPNSHLYNNTFATFNKAGGNANCSSYQNAPNGVAKNNICHDTDTGGDFPVGGITPPNNGNLAFSTGYSGAWLAPYAQELTYAKLSNKNPLFTNFPSTGELSASSPAIGTGVNLTTVSTGDSGSGTTLTVSDARYFQPGWAGTQADWIRIGPSTIAQIASINYSTNTITLTNSITRSAGDPVYLYKNSKGTVVLFGSLQDVGAYPTNFGTTGSPPPAPGNLTVQ